MGQKRTTIAIFGEDVSKSLSPRMQNAAFQKCKLPFHYIAISMPKSAFKREFEKARRSYLGLNITIPYKEVAPQYLSRLSARARKLEAVNTVLFGDKKSFGENTDVDGLLFSIHKLGCQLEKNKRAFILGAGGAARATVEALHLLGLKRFVVATRSKQRAQSFKRWFQKNYSRLSTLESLGLSASSNKKWKERLRDSTIFVNAAPAQATKNLSFFREIEFSETISVVDWVYVPRITPWIEKGRRAKGTCVPGYKLLLYQGMKSFELWTGVDAPEKVMEKALLQGLE